MFPFFIILFFSAKDEPLKRNEDNIMKEKNPFGDFSQPKGGNESINQFDFGGFDANINPERKDSGFKNPFEEKKNFKNSEFQSNTAFNRKKIILIKMQI